MSEATALSMPTPIPAEALLPVVEAAKTPASSASVPIPDVATLGSVAAGTLASPEPDATTIAETIEAKVAATRKLAHASHPDVAHAFDRQLEALCDETVAVTQAAPLAPATETPSAAQTTIANILEPSANLPAANDLAVPSAQSTPPVAEAPLPRSFADKVGKPATSHVAQQAAEQEALAQQGSERQL